MRGARPSGGTTTTTSPDQWKEVRRHDKRMSLSRHLRVRADVPTDNRLSLRLLSADPTPAGDRRRHLALKTATPLCEGTYGPRSPAAARRQSAQRHGEEGALCGGRTVRVGGAPCGSCGSFLGRRYLA